MSKRDERKRSLVGRKFTRLLVVEEAGTDKKGAYQCLCLCDCGTTKVVSECTLVTENTKSCGCLRRETMRQKKTTHGLTDSPEYEAWQGLKSRCNDSTDSYYGGRGITVCDRWLNSFTNFYQDMGPKPEPKQLYSIERKNNKGNYEPSNCKWATKSEQMKNRDIDYQSLAVEGWKTRRRNLQTPPV